MILPVPLDHELLNYLIDEDDGAALHLEGLAREIAAVDRRFEPLCDVEATTERFLKLMRDNVFLPAPPILCEGRKNNPVLFRGTALTLSDNFDQIFSVLRRTSTMLQNGIEVRLDFSGLRASRSLIRSSHLQSVGPVGFMELFERAPQGGLQKSPLHFILRVDHLDIEKYLDYAASAPPHVRCAVGITENFMRALAGNGRIGLTHRDMGEVSEEVAAADLFQRFAKLTLDGKALGFIFIDTVREFLDIRQLSDELTINPQNQLVFPGEFMATGMINLRNLVTGDGLDEARFGDVVRDAVHFLDNCFEKNFYFDEESKIVTRANLRIGLSVAGLGEVLESLNPEGMERRGNKIIEQILTTLFSHSIHMSHELGEKRGMRRQIFFQGKWHRARHSQTIAQIHLPVLNQLMDTPAYFFKRGMSFNDFLLGCQTHARWQADLGNIAAFKYPVNGLDDEKFRLLFLQTHETKSLTLEFA